MSQKQCSELFEEVFASHCGGCERTCKCGRVHFDSYNTYDWEDGELEKLLSKAKKNPEKYIERDGSVGCMEIDGYEIVYGCVCDLAKNYEKFILLNAERISEYLIKYAQSLREKADKVDMPQYLKNK